MFPWLCSTTAALVDDKDNFVCSNEEDTVDDVTLDAYGLYGIKCTYYHVSEDLDRDKLYGEDQLREIERSWYFMGYVQQLPPNVRSYQLQGIWGEDVVTLYASINAFDYYSTYGGYDKNMPEVYNECPAKIGDIVYLNPNDTFYRVVDVKYYSEAFGLAKHTYTMTLKVYKDNKWTVSADSPTIANPDDPIYQVANYPMSSCYQIDDPLKIQPFVADSAKDNPDPYNNINVMYDPEAPARNKFRHLQEEIAKAASMLSAEFANINTDIGLNEQETNDYINRTIEYKSENDTMIADATEETQNTKEQLVNVSANGVELEDIGHNKEKVYYTKTDDLEDDTWP